MSFPRNHAPFWTRPLWRVLLLALFVTGCLPAPAPTQTAPPPPPPTPDTRLVVTWVDGGDLFAWRSGESFPRRVASGAVITPHLNPDGTRIAFTRGSQGVPLALWVVDVDGVAERQLVGPADLAVDTDTAQVIRQINRVAWLDADTLLFNTALLPVLPGPGGARADDLWRVDVQAGSASRLLPDGQGGDFAPSPDGTQIALVTPGGYASTQGTIRLTTAQGEALGTLLTFDGVSTASEYAFYPALHWLPDSAALLTAIPDPDLVYPTEAGQSPRMTALWRLPVDGPAVQTGTIPAAFFGLPRWSPDGAWLTYLQQVGSVADNTLAIMVAAGDGSAAQQVISGTVGTLDPPLWSAAGYTYTYGEPGTLWLATPDLPPARFPVEGESAYFLRWADATTAVYASAPTAPYELRTVDRDNPIPGIIATINDAPPIFDAVRYHH